MSDSFNVLEYAQKLVAAGISVIPIRVNSPKKAAVSWDEYQSRLATPRELTAWFRGLRRGLAAIGGSVSGGLECLDFDEPGLFERWADELDFAVPGLLPRLAITKTPKGGAHVWFRSTNCEPNQVLAKRPATQDEAREKPQTRWYKRIETRGAGGYALLPGSPPECHEALKPYEYSQLGRGDLLLVEVVSIEERQRMIGLCRSFNSYAEPQKPQTSSRDDNLPGNDFDLRGDWQEILEPHGWKLEKGDWNNGHLTRPGKDDGASATIGVCRGEQHGEPLLYVFSTSTEFEASKAYGRFRAYAILNHRGNNSAAAKALAQKGYGSPPQQKSRGNNPRQQDPPVDEDNDAYELVLTSLRGRKARPVHYLVHGKVPVGKVTMIAGVGGTGKSSLTRHMIACLTTGRCALGLQYDPPPPCDVLLASVEDSPEDTIVPHLIAEGADLDRVILLEGVRKKLDDKTMPFNLMDLQLVIRTLKAKPSIKVLIIDPIMSFVGRAGVNENASSEVRTLLDPLIPLAEETGISVVLIAHLNKATNVAAVNRIAGSTAFRDTCRVVFAYGVDPNDDTKRILAPVKANPMGFDRSSLAFKLRKLTDDQLAEVLADEAFSELSPKDLDRIGQQLSMIEPVGASDCDADGVVGGGQQERAEKISGGRKQPSQAECTEWLKGRLGDRWWYDEDIEAEAVGQGWSIWVYRKAKGFIPGLRSKRLGFQGHFRIGIGNIDELTKFPSEFPSLVESSEKQGKSQSRTGSDSSEIDSQSGAQSRTGSDSSEIGETLDFTANGPSSETRTETFSDDEDPGPDFWPA